MNIKHKNEAEERNLTLISEKAQSCDDLNYKLYMFNKCNHYQDLQPTHVRRGNVKCNTCFEDNIRSLALEKGFTLVGKCESDKFRLVKRNICGHVTKIRHSLLNRRNVDSEELDSNCDECYTMKLQEDAENANMIYLGKSLNKNGIFRNYQFKSCGHTKDIRTSCIVKGNFHCSECIENRYKTEAKYAGLEYIGFTANKSDCKRHYKLECGHTKDMRMEHARDGVYLCSECGDSYYTKPSSIYLLKITASDSFTWLKLGFSKNLKIRKNNYGLDKDCRIELLYEVNVPTGIIAVNNEKNIHKLMKEFRIDKSFMKSYHKDNGFTECYNISAEKLILIYMQNINKEKYE